MPVRSCPRSPLTRSAGGHRAARTNTNITLGGPFASPRTRPGSLVIERFSCILTIQVVERFSARGQALNARRCAPREGEPSLHFRVALLVSEVARLRLRPGSNRPRLHRADACARASHQVSARFRPRTTTDSPVCNRSTPVAPALHSAGTASAPCLAYAPSFRRSQTGETVRTARARPGENETPTAAMLRISARTSNMAARLRPARTPQYGARLRLPPKTSALARAASPGQDDRNSRGDGQPSRRSAGCACETARPRW